MSHSFIYFDLSVLITENSSLLMVTQMARISIIYTDFDHQELSQSHSLIYYYHSYSPIKWVYRIFHLIQPTSHIINRCLDMFYDRGYLSVVYSSLVGV
jgi:hypothetical protein